jgi:hypothetical protein
MTMGKVIPLDANRRNSSAARIDTGVRASISMLVRAFIRALGGAVIRSTFALGRVFLLACSAGLITLLAVIGWPLRVLARLGAVAVLISAGLEYFDHWRHLQLLFVAAGALVFVAVLVICHERLLEGVTGIHSRARGHRV